MQLVLWYRRMVLLGSQTTVSPESLRMPVEVSRAMGGIFVAGTSISSQPSGASGRRTRPCPRQPNSTAETTTNNTVQKEAAKVKEISKKKERKMVSYMSLLLYGVGGIVVAGMALLVAFQERLVYVPVLPGLTKFYPITPSRLRLLYEDVWLHSSDGVRLHAWLIKLTPQCQGPTILFFQENAGNIAHRLEMVHIMIQRLQCNVFMLSYRGYGASDGYPSQPGITKDAQAALDHLSQRTDIDSSRIIVFGRSLGGAVGALLTKNNPDKISALILENTFTSILDMAGVLLPFLKWFIGGPGSNYPKILNFLVRSPWNTIEVIGQIKQPILFLSGLQDEMVPPVQMQMLYAKAAAHNRECTFVEFPTGMHMDTWLTGGDHYWRTVLEFIEKYAPEKKENRSSEGDKGGSFSP